MRLRVFLALALLLASVAPSFGGTIVHLGEVREFNGPDDLELDPARVVVAVDVFGDIDREVNGVMFKSDRAGVPGVTVTASNSIDNWATRPSYSGADPDSADNLELIMRDIRWTPAPNPVAVEVSGLTPGIEYELQMLFNEGGDRDRRWDIAVEGELVVDDFSSEGEGVWSPSNGFAYIVPFSLVAGDTTLNVDMREHIGGQDPLGSDHNPILQAFTITEVTIPPTPEDLELAPAEFFATQTAAVGSLSTTDLKRNSTHIYSFSESGGADNDKFEITDETIVPGPYDFGAHAAGSTFTIRVRTTDAEDPARFLEEDFILTLADPLPPTALTLDASSISAGAIVGTPAGRFSSADANAVDEHSYSLVSGSGDADNDLFTIDGNVLLVAAPIPGNQPSVALRVRTTDLSGLSHEETFTLLVTEPSLRINELMASNGTTLRDEDGDYSDWIELFNEQSGAANLNGWHLTDDLDDLTKWPLPAVTIGANGYLVVFLSGKDRTPINGNPLHANFQLDAGGETVALLKPDGTIASEITFPDQHPDVSYGVGQAGNDLGFLQTATPDGANSETAAQIVNEVTFDHERGYYQEGFDLTLTPTVPGSTIRYTTNGSRPTASNGSIYSGPIAIGPETGSSTRGTRRVRAIAVHPTAALSPVSTHTYLFVNGTGDPSSTGVLGQSHFRSAITGHAVYGPQMDDGLLALPSISIVKSGGVGSSEGETSLELIPLPGTEAGFQIDCGIKLVGGASVGSPKNNFRCYFRSNYGSPKLRYPLFADHPYTRGASEEFDVIQLRSGSHDNFYWMALPSNPPISFRHGDAQYVRNRFTSDVEMLMGQPSLHGRWAHCYLNGAYHGIYHVHERPMHHWMDKYFGGDPEDYHYTNSGRNGSDHGGGDSWNATWSQVKSAASAGGEASKDWINWESLADNQLLYYYFGNDWDWTTTHNWMAAGPNQPGEGGWRFYSWDCDVSMYDINANNLNQNAPDGVFSQLMNDPDFRVYFRDRIYRHCFHDGVLRPNGLREAHDYRMNELFEAIVPETARWQPSSATSLPWDRDGEWRTEWNYMRNVYWPQRTAILLNQFRSRGWYPVEAPEFTPHGGSVAAGFSPLIDAPEGTIYVTTDGSDPRLPGGAVNPNAQAFTENSVITTVVPAGSSWKYLDDGSDQGTAWREAAFNDGAWQSGDAELGYGDGDEDTVISFGPDTGDRHITSYFRKRFTVTGAAGITGMQMELKRDDGAVVYLNGAEVWRSNLPGGPIDSETLAIEGLRSPAESTFITKSDVLPSLLQEGENVFAVEIHQVRPTDGDHTFDFRLSVTRPSDPSQLQIFQSTLMKARVLHAGDWSPVNAVTYTIGPPADADNLVVSEIHYRPSAPTPAEDPGDLYSRTDYEFVELTNISDGPIHLVDVRFTDGLFFDFAGRPLVGLDAGESALLVEDRAAFLLRYPAVSPDRIAGEYDGNLSNDGERLEILGAGDSVIRAFTFNDKAPWPEAADGDGYSLELINPGSNPDHTVPSNWRASRGIHGTPDGHWTTLDFAAWQLLNFNAAELADPSLSGPDGDLDLDGRTNFLEFVQGTAPDDGITRIALPTGSLMQFGPNEHLSLVEREWLGTDGVTRVPEVSYDLVTWFTGPGHVVEEGSIDHGDGTRTRTYRATRALSEQPRQFIRMKMLGQ